MTAKRIALLEDDVDQSALVELWLADAGHSCQAYSRGNALLSALGRETYDLLVLDWCLPDMNGDQVLAQVRSRLDWHVPVLFTTSRDSETDIVHALNLGADDYLVKPLRRMEFLARINALVRRTVASSEKPLQLDFGMFSVDFTTRSISRGGTTIDLTDKEYELAVFLFQNPGRLLSRGHVLESVWGRNPGLDTRTVDMHVSRIRRKLKLGVDSGWRLAAVYQHGYRLEPVQDGTPPAKEAPCLAS
jgi:DNA-binding response OmpR family regulator